MTVAEPRIDDVLLRDGRIGQVRAVRDSDRQALLALHRELSDDSRYRRFLVFGRAGGDVFVNRLLAGVEEGAAAAFVVLLHDRIVGVGSFIRTGPHTAEPALTVADDVHGCGVGTLLLERLAAAAAGRGITEFVATLLSTNAEMLEVFSTSGLEVTVSRDRETVEVRCPVGLTERLTEAMTAREQTADAASVRGVLTPTSVAVIGASRRAGSPGNQVLRNLIEGGFAGAVHAVNPRAAEVLGLPAYDSVVQIPGPVDLAVIAVPADSVVRVIEECVARDVKGAVILSAGFGEAGPTGRLLQDRVLRTARDGGLRIVGPNCLGIANTDPAVRLDATFAPTRLRAGSVGLITQSGAVGIAVLQRADELGIGLSHFVSVGNKADVSGNDMLMYADHDDRTRVVALYLESFGNPRKFSRLARRVGARKPVVALVGGASRAGGRAAAGHTAGAVTSTTAVTALFGQCGVIHTRALEQFLQVAGVLSHQPLPGGGRVAIIGNGGGPNVLTADACAAAGLELADLSEATSGAIADAVQAASLTNPVDLGAGVTAAAFGTALAAALADPAVDVLIAVHTPVPALSDAEFTATLQRAVDGRRPKTTVAVMLGSGTGRQPIPSGEHPIPVFAFPEEAAAALGPVVRHVRWRSTPRGTVPDLPGIDAGAARRIVADLLTRRPDGGWLAAEDCRRLLGCYGIGLEPMLPADDAEEAVRVADRIGHPVVLKIADPEVVHKSAAGGVRLDLGNPDAVRAAYREICAAAPHGTGRVLVQRQLPPGVELIVGVTADDTFGPLVMFGRGGTDTELVADLVFRLTPLTDADVHATVGSLRSSPLLFGWRGRPPADVAALEDLLLRIGRLADDLPAVSEIDLNPVIAAPSGVAVVDAKVRIRPHRDRPDPLLPGLRPVSPGSPGGR